ncbi:hypothetical protein FRB94_004148 [Tulasnella sp. JGI-2019a]|nr:hypothetical protein FRB94_004148 [Tulasnella sp. JGI-2019a]
MAMKTTQSHPSAGGTPASLTSWYSSNHSPRKGSAVSVQANETKKVLDPFLKRELAGTIFEVELDQFVSTFFPCALPEQEKYSAAAEACLADWVANKTNKVPWEQLISATEAVGIIGTDKRNDKDEDGSGVGKEEDGPVEPP